MGRRHRHKPQPEARPQKGERNAEVPSRKRKPERFPNEGTRECIWLSGGAPRGDEGAREMPRRLEGTRK
jgi:hypothetical protein